MERFLSVVGDIMSHAVVTVDWETNVRNATILMMKKTIGFLIIVERGKPVGFVTRKDTIHRVISLCTHRRPATSAGASQESEVRTIHVRLGFSRL